MGVTVGLNHSESALTLVLKVSSRGNISIVYDLENTAEDVDVGTNEEVVGGDAWNLLFLQENASVLNIEHLDGFEDREV